jgi:hypothetical protein
VDGETYAVVEFHREAWEEVSKLERQAMRYLDEEVTDAR